MPCIASNILRILPTTLFLISLCWQTAAAEMLEIHIDADYSISADAAQSIENGLRVALSEVGGQIADYQIEIVANDHRGNVRRSRRTMESFLENDNALALVGGLHSPPYLTHQKFINKNEILTLLPWSAAGAITRPMTDDDNWIFRLSVDDLKAAPFLVDEVIQYGGCAHVGLVLIDSGWGRGNHATLTAALEERGRIAIFSRFFDAGVSHANAAALAQDFALSGADCAIVLSSWENGTEVILALHEHVPNLRVFSHWGVMGGQFAERVPHDIRTDLDLRVLQTCGLRREADGSEILSAAIRAIDETYDRLSDVPASTGFVHGYDLMRVFIAAVQQASTTQEWDGDIVAKRAAVRDALEHLESPVEGILKTFAPPFGPYTPEKIDAHEALGIADLCMARFGSDDKLTLIK